MKSRMAWLALVGLVYGVAPAAGQDRQEGFIPIVYESKTGKLLLEVTRLDHDILYLNSLATGLGSNDLGLDRGTIGDEAVVRFERHGPRVFLVRRNTGFRATSGDANETRAVEESFASSVMASFPIQNEDGGRLTVDATDFLLSDVFDVRGALQRSQQGTFRLDRNRSAIYLPRTKAFPKNTEIEVTLTYESDAPGREVARHTPEGRALTLRQHHSFVELPDSGYKPRAFDPRVGVNPASFYDFSQPLNREPVVRWIARWRLDKKDPAAAKSEPVKPIVYYIDRGVPEPYRTAFRDGARWWNRVFEAADFTNAFVVEDLPDDVDPMDARYSVVQWVHRTDPGFSIGPSFRDPRTGEIIKAAVKMDSYRSITDYNIFAGLQPASEANDDWIGSLDPNVNGTEFAMARRRQHVAHEIGHTLGLAHNFIAHADGRSSVMDYPAPLITLKPNGTLDLSQAYRNGPGAYDTLAIRYAYTTYASPEAERAGLAALVRQGIAQGIRFYSDRDAAESGSMSGVTRWLNGDDAIAELERQTAIRKILLGKFGESVLAAGDPLSLLNKRLVPVYLHHRYAIEAVIKDVGGMDYTFALKGDGQMPTQPVSPAQQRRALRALMAAIQPSALTIPERIVARIPPPPYGYGGDGWAFASNAGVAFDPLAVARALSAYVADGILNPTRVARVISFNARNSAAPSADEVIGAMIEAVYTDAAAATSYERAVRRVSRRAVVDALLNLAASQNATADARAVAELHLNRLATRLATVTATDAGDRAANAAVVRDTRNWLDKRIAPPRTNAVIQLPPGTPIGN